MPRDISRTCRSKVAPRRYNCCISNNESNLCTSEIRRVLIPQTEYQEEYTKEFKQTSAVENRLRHAGVSSKDKPECQPQEYDISDGIVPRFKGESLARSSYQPQPLISKLESFKPPNEATKPPILLGPEMMEVQSYSNWTHSPMPLELARKTAPIIPLWIREKLKPTEYKTRYDLTTNYQADYCGVQTKPRNICYQINDEVMSDGGNHFNIGKNPTLHGNQRYDTTKDQETLLWKYVNSLLYRTTTGNTYLPPSAFGEPMCHPTQYHPNKQY